MSENNGQIPGGCILLSRKILENELFKDTPPAYFKVFIWLLLKAQHKPYKKLKRGQLWTTYRAIALACGV